MSVATSTERPMNQVIPVMNKLQDVFSAVGREAPIALPQIVVIGSQSCGKSSVLEGLVGRDFLPRGSGVVTRRPIVLQLHNIPRRGMYGDAASAAAAEEAMSRSVARSALGGAAGGSASGATEGPEAAAEAAAALAAGYDVPEWAEFEHRPGKKFDMGDVKDEIIRETERVAGRGKGIIREPIRIRIFSPHVLNLTLVDLPGMTRVPVGDQPSDIERQVRDMCLEYISEESSLILAVTAANADIATSDAIKMAMDVDPSGMRTVGVLTKLDLMDPGTDASEVLLGRVIPLRRGFVGVVCRSQKDIVDGVSMEESRRRERRFFELHPAYRSMAARMGSSYLATVLNQLLMHHARAAVPELKTRITGMLQDIQRQVDALGEPIEAQSRATQGGLLLSLLSRFAQNYCDAIEGKPFEGMQRMYGRDIVGGARVGHVFRHVFRRRVEELDPLESVSDEEIRVAIRNAGGTRSPLTVPDAAFESLVQRLIRRLEPAGLSCVDLVYQELQSLTAECRTDELRRFGELHERVVDVVGAMLRRAVVPTQTMVSNLIHIELAHVNTEHPDFIGSERATLEVREDMGLGGPGEDMYVDDPSGPGAPWAIGGAGGAGGAAGGGARWGGAPDATPYSEAPTSTLFHSPGAPSPPLAKAKEAARHGSVAASLGPGEVVPRYILPQLGPPSTQERFEINVMRKLLESYFHIAKKTFLDMVPKTIMCFLVNHSKENVQSELVRVLYAESLFDDLLRETDSVATTRYKCIEMRSLLRQALATVEEVRDFAIVA